MHNKTRIIGNIVKRYWLYVFVIVLGIIMHFGTAILRLRTFFPIPVLVDFSAFYTSAAAVHQEISPYGLPANWLAKLQAEMLMPVHPPAIFNPPLWPWLLQPFASLSYPTATWVWLLCNLGLLLWISRIVQKKISETKHFQSIEPVLTHWDLFFNSYPFLVLLSLFFLMTTFGPVFLDLSIGQTSIVLMAMCIIIGLQLHAKDNWRPVLLTGLALGLSTVAKLYPAVWVIPFVLMRRWKHFFAGITSIIIVLGAGFLILPDINLVYWQQILPQRLFTATDQVSMDDQSLVAWLDRMSQPHTYIVPGIEAAERKKIIWQPTWTLDAQSMRVGGYLLCAIIGVLIITALTQQDRKYFEGGFYLWVLYILVTFPHMERYNHVLLLPAMVWLWQKGQHKLVIMIYFMTGLSRLNHLWIITLPYPLGPLASGFGLFAVLTAIGGMLVEFKHHPVTPRNL